MCLGQRDTPSHKSYLLRLGQVFWLFCVLRSTGCWKSSARCHAGACMPAQMGHNENSRRGNPISEDGSLTITPDCVGGMEKDESMGHKFITHAGWHRRCQRIYVYAYMISTFIIIVLISLYTYTCIYKYQYIWGYNNISYIYIYIYMCICKYMHNMTLVFFLWFSWTSTLPLMYHDTFP